MSARLSSSSNEMSETKDKLQSLHTVAFAGNIIKRCSKFFFSIVLQLISNGSSLQTVHNRRNNEKHQFKITQYQWKKQIMKKIS